MEQFAQPLREEDVDPDPVRQFETWFEVARASGLRLPEAAALATATASGVPSLRMVLVKETAASGFVFYSSFDSRKGRELAVNPHVALLFYWDALGRQVRIEGEARLAQQRRALELAVLGPRRPGPVDRRLAGTTASTNRFPG